MPASDPFAKIDNAATALDGIRAGGGVLLVLAHQRINEARDHLTAGRFDKALESANVLREKLSHLAQSQISMGILADNTLVRVSDLRVGMVVPNLGPITEVGPCPGCGQENCNNISFTVAEATMVMDGDVEMVVEAQGA